MSPEKCESCPLCINGACMDPDFPKCYLELMSEVLTDEEKSALEVEEK